MAGTPGGLTASIRRKLHEGKTPDEIVQELVAGGLGQISAQRFVDRALAEDASGAALPPAPLPMPESPATASNEVDPLDQFIREKSAQTQAAEAKSGSKSLWAGSLLMCGGIVITAGSYITADVGERYTLMWGPVVFGFLLWGKAVLGGLANARSFAWMSAAASIALPVVLTVAALGVVAATEPELTEEEMIQAEIAGIINAKNTGDTVQAAKEQSMDDAVNAARAALDPEVLLKDFDAATPDRQCEAAGETGKYKGEDDEWLAVQLESRMTQVDDRVKICLAAAITEIHPRTAIKIYDVWRGSDSAALRAAGDGALRHWR